VDRVQQGKLPGTIQGGRVQPLPAIGFEKRTDRRQLSDRADEQVPPGAALRQDARRIVDLAGIRDVALDEQHVPVVFKRAEITGIAIRSDHGPASCSIGARHRPPDVARNGSDERRCRWGGRLVQSALLPAPESISSFRPNSQRSHKTNASLH